MMSIYEEFGGGIKKSQFEENACFELQKNY